jgi:hypothetical protein
VAIIFEIAYSVSRLVANLLSDLLGGLGFDGLPEEMGIGQAFTGDLTPSRLVGKVIVFFVMLFAAVEAANRLGFVRMADLVSGFIQFCTEILLGGLIVVVGFWLSNLAYGAIVRVSGAQATGVVSVARFGILRLVTAMGLRQMEHWLKKFGGE